MQHSPHQQPQRPQQQHSTPPPPQQPQPSSSRPLATPPTSPVRIAVPSSPSATAATTNPAAAGLLDWAQLLQLQHQSPAAAAAAASAAVLYAAAARALPPYGHQTTALSASASSSPGPGGATPIIPGLSLPPAASDFSPSSSAPSSPLPAPSALLVGSLPAPAVHFAPHIFSSNSTTPNFMSSSSSSSSSSSPSTKFHAPAPSSPSSPSSPSPSSSSATSSVGQPAPSSSGGQPAFYTQLPASVRAVLAERDVVQLASRLGIGPERMVTFFRNEASLAFFKVSDLKTVVNYLKGTLGKTNLRISGTKSDLTTRIADELFRTTGHHHHQQNNAGGASEQTTLTGFSSSGFSSTASSTASRGGSAFHAAQPPSKRPRTSAAVPLAPAAPASSVNYNQKLVIMPPNSTYSEPAFQLQQNPYYRVLRQLCVFGFGPKGRPTAYDRPQFVRHAFNIDALTVQEIRKDTTRKLGVHVRFFSTFKNSDIVLGYDSSLKVNGKLVDLTKNYKKIRSKHIQNPFVTPYPAEITSLIAESNMMEFSNTKCAAGVAVVQLIQEITTEEILPSIPRSSPEYKKPTSAGNEIEETKVLVSLRCPLGYCRIEYPAKGFNCKHLQCFDVRFFLQFCHQQRLWHCPVCNGPIPFSELIIDEYFNTILKSMDSETMKVEIHPDGTFTKPDKSEKKQRLAGSKRKEVGVQEIDLDDEAARQREQRPDQDAQSSDSTDAFILRPIRIERTSDDEDEDGSGGSSANADHGDDGVRGEMFDDNDDEDEEDQGRFSSEGSPGLRSESPDPPGLRDSDGFSSLPPRPSQADTIIID